MSATPPPDAASPAMPAAPAAAAPRRRWRSPGLLGATLLLPGLLASAGLGLWWSLKTASGSAWLLAKVPGLQVEAPSGALLGDFSARRLSWRSTDLQIELLDLRWQRPQLRWTQSPLQWGAIEFAQMQARRVSLSWPDSPASDTPVPADLLLPLALTVGELRVAELRLPGLGQAPLRDIQARLELGAEQGRQHRLRLDSLGWEHWRLSGDASIASQGALPLRAALQADQGQPGESGKGSDWHAALQLQGPLAELQAQGQVQRAGQQLTLQATLRPLAAWPLGSAQARAEHFDLAALSPALPHTAISGHAELRSGAKDQPALLDAELSNTLAGRWDQQRLPLRQLTLKLSGRPDQLGSDAQGLAALQVQTLEAQLGSREAPAGRISAQGSAVAVQAQLSEIRTAALDQRLPRLRLGGRLDIRNRPATAHDALPLALQGRLDGSWEGPPGSGAPQAQALSLELQASSEQLAGGQRQIDISQARLASNGAPVLDANALLTSKGAAWQARLKLAAQTLDPRLLWAGEADGAWRRGRHQINARLDADLAGTTRSSWPRGNARLQLAPSQLGGVALQGRLDYQAADSAAPRLQGDLDLAGNRLKLDASSDSQAEIAAELPQLAALNPLLALWQPQARLGGSLRGHLRLEAQGQGSARSWRSSGRLDGQALEARGLPGLDGLSLAGGTVDWALDSRADAPQQLKAGVQRLLSAYGRLDQLDLQLQGSWARHQIRLDGLGQLVLPGALARLSAQDSTRVNATAQIEGRLDRSPWSALAEGLALQWQASASQLRLRPVKASLPAWLDLPGLGLSLSYSPRSDLLQATLSPGRGELGGAMLRWQQLQFQSDTSGPALQADLALEPLAVAPLLARWQPDFGWGGNLVMGGRVLLRSAPSVEVDITLQRADGDLTVTDDAGVQALGLSELRLGLLAREGTWHLTQAVAGRNLGAIGGALSARTSPQALWPGPDAPLEGVMTAHIENLGNWGAWVPPGWRLGGQLDASLSLGGRVGAPEIQGRAEGEQIAVRQALAGVDVSEGSFALRLDGATATLERLKAKAGQGSLSASGQAQLGATPQAHLELQAERFQLLGRVDRRLVGSGRAQLDLGENTLKLDGRFTVDEGLFDFSRADAPSLDDDVRVKRVASAAETPAARAPARERTIALKLVVDLGRQLRVVGRGLDTRLAGELQLGHAKGRPTLNGVVQTVGGTYDAYGQKLEIEKGEISFTGAYDNPRLDVLAIRPNIDTRVGVTLGGTALNPRVKLYSDPELAETEKLSWLVLGRAPDELGRTDTALLQRAALALLAGEGESATGRLMKNLGLDEISVGQDADQTRGTVLRLGKQLSTRWYLGYERSLNATTGSWQLIYRIAQRFTLRAQSGAENAVDLIRQWKWE